jgi:hypothetical protein
MHGLLTFDKWFIIHRTEKVSKAFDFKGITIAVIPTLYHSTIDGIPHELYPERMYLARFEMTRN